MKPLLRLSVKALVIREAGVMDRSFQGIKPLTIQIGQGGLPTAGSKSRPRECCQSAIEGFALRMGQQNMCSQCIHLRPDSQLREFKCHNGLMTFDSESFPKIEHHGAVDGVTGSCHELKVDTDNSVLVDCGLFQGEEVSRRGAGADIMDIEFDLGPIQALLVTHVHIDHVGRIPYLLDAGFKGPIFCSKPSAVLLPMVLEDAYRIGFTRDRNLVKQFLNRLKKRIVAIPYNQWQDVSLKNGASLAVRYQKAGHILGSSYIECRTGSGKSSRITVFSGDLGAPYAPLLAAPKSPYAADTVVIESTYGDRVHESRKERKNKLRKALLHALRDGGVVMIPAFSIGRTQELLYEIEDIIHRLKNHRVTENLQWRDLPVIIDSPLAARFTDAYRQLKPYWDEEAHQKVRAGRHPLSFDQLITIDSHHEHKRLVKRLASTREPCVVLAASGMCSGGRIVNYVKALIGDSRNDIVFVGYQAKGSPGRSIQRYGPENGYVVLDGKRYTINARVATLGGYSAHADQSDLVRFIRRIKRPPSEIRVVHGDDDAKLTLQNKLNEMMGTHGTRVVIP